MVVIGTAWPEFKPLSADSLCKSGGPVTVIDPWRILPIDLYHGLAHVVQSGRGCAEA